MSMVEDVRRDLSGRLGDVATKYWGPLGKKAFDTADEFRRQLEADAGAFLDRTQEDLNRWSDLAEEGKLTPDELEFLLMGKRDLAEMHGLKQAGLALVQVQRMQSLVIQVLISTVFDVLLERAEES